MPTTEDRINALFQRADEFTGLAFVQVVEPCEQTLLRVYFVTDPAALRPPFFDIGDPTVVPEPITWRDVSIYSPRGEAPEVRVIPCPGAGPGGLVFGVDAAVGRAYVEVCVEEPGTFTDYALRIEDPRIDRVFNDVPFSFKVGCPTLRDCAVPPVPCPPLDSADFPVDYLARDFVSLRRALLDFAAQRYPSWQKPMEADVGTMLAEVMAALGDEFSYVQDRHNREAYLETATERRSLRRKARLLDHEIHDGRMATTVLELAVPATTSQVPVGAPVWVRAAGNLMIPFEIGRGLGDPDTAVIVDAAWNAGALVPYAFDEDDECLAAGAREVVVENNGAFDAASAALWASGHPLLLRSVPQDAADTEHLHLVTVREVVLTEDLLMNQPLAILRWDAADAPRRPFPLDRLELSGNLVRATAGARRTRFFRIGPLGEGEADAGIIRAVERSGPLYSRFDPGLAARTDPCAEGEAEEPLRPPVYLLSLPETDTIGLAFADTVGDIRRTVPQIRLAPVANVAADPVDPWTFRRSLLYDGPDDEVYTLEDGTWRTIVTHYDRGQRKDHVDYATGAGYTVRLGDGEFGEEPAEGTLFRVDYRLGFGTRANVPAGSINLLAADGVASPLAGLVTAVANPFEVTDGVDPESHEAIRTLTPEAYQAATFFAVRPQDYGRQAETLSFVQRAEGAFRWTGSWLSAFTAVDPIDAGTLTAERRVQVETLLDWRRQAGREVIVKAPRYLNLDLVITICVAPSAYPGQVRARVMTALTGLRGREDGFFGADNFTFGTALRRSRLEAAILAVGGVTAVLSVAVRRLGETAFAPLDELLLPVEPDEVIRVSGDPARPEEGMVTILTEGGA